MADDYTTRLRFVRQVTNANTNVWGAYLNTKALDLIDSAIAGWANIDLSSGNATLTTGNGAADEARMAFLRPYGSGTTTRTITIPSLEKCYKVKNDYGGQVLIKTAAGVGVTVLPNTMAEVWCNGSECYRAWVSDWGLISTTATTSGTSKSFSFSVTGQAFTRAMLVFNATLSAPGTAVGLTTTGPAGTSSSATFITSASAITGELEITNLTGGIGTIVNRTSYVASSPGVTAYNPTGSVSWRSVGGLTGITITPGNAWSAGSIETYLQ